MADDRLRSLVREAALGGPDARARLLVARLRAGELSVERLRLAAYLGDPDARRAAGPAAPRSPRSLEALLRGLGAFGPEPCLHAALAVGRVFEAHGPPFERHDVRALREVLDALSLWLDCPCRAHTQDLRTAVDPAPRQLDVVEWAARAALEGVETAGARAAAASAWRDVWRGGGRTSMPRAVLFLHAHAKPMRVAVAARLVPWALCAPAGPSAP